MGKISKYVATKHAAMILEMCGGQPFGESLIATGEPRDRRTHGQERGDDQEDEEEQADDTDLEAGLEVLVVGLIRVDELLERLGLLGRRSGRADAVAERAEDLRDVARPALRTLPEARARERGRREITGQDDQPEQRDRSSEEEPLVPRERHVHEPDADDEPRTAHEREQQAGQDDRQGREEEDAAQRRGCALPPRAWITTTMAR